MNLNFNYAPLKQWHRRKILLSMKLTAILMLTFLINVHAKSYSQQISIHVKNASVEKVISLIEKQSDYRFLYDSYQLNKNIRLTVAATNVSIEELLKQCFAKQPVEYKLFEQTVVLKSKPVSVPSNVSQDMIIRGTVTDDKNNPLVGVSIKVKNTANATQTGSNGDFSITVPTGNETLVLSYLGFITQEIPINGRTSLNITLKEDLKALGEVVVVGYGTVKKSDLTGSVVSLQPDDLNKGNNTSVDQLLQGRAPGVQITQSSSEPGGAATIRIRGASSLGTSNEPLYVIDGLPIDNSAPVNGFGSTSAGFTGNQPPRNPLNSLSPNDIASIDILKDASATAIYGSRGANGVILITTKSGQAGKLKIDYNPSFTFSNIAKKIDVLNTSQYIDVINSLEVARGKSPVFDAATIQSFGNGTDWQDELYRSTISQNHDLALSGGSDKTQFYVSLNYNKQNGLIKNSDFNRYQGRINLKHQASDKFRIGLNFNTSSIRNDYVPVNGFDINQNADAINSALNAPPVFPVYNDDGSFFQIGNAQTASVTLENPLALIYGQTGKEQTNRTFGNIYAEYNLTPELVAKLNLGNDRSVGRRDVFNSTLTATGAAANGIAFVSVGQQQNNLAEFTLNYTRKFNTDHDFNLLVGTTYQQFKNDNVNSSARGFDSDVIKTNNLGLGIQNLFDVGSGLSERVLISYLGRANYAYKNKYLLTASIRADGSSNFGANNRFGYFPSFSVAWKINEEAFLKNNKTISELKLRTSWGQIGNDAIGSGNAFTTYSSSGNGAVFGQNIYTSISAARIPNPDLKWETSQQFNVGADVGLFGSRLNFTIDYFDKKTKDLLQGLSIPISTGFGTITSNVGEIDNSGIEFLLNSRNLVNKLKWNTTFNFATLKNKVVDLGPVNERIYGAGGATVIARPGDALFSYYGLKAAGIFQNQAEIDASAQKSAKPGDPKWVDLNNDGVIDNLDRQILGNPFPKLTLGLANDFSYKNFDLSFFIEAVNGVDLMSWELVDALIANDPYRNRLAEPLLNRWTPDNPTNEHPSAINPASYQGGNVNSFTIMDASFIRLKNVQLAYKIPLKANKYIRDARIFISGQNLALITNYVGYDPDVNSTGTNNIRIDRNSYPSARSFIVGFNLGL